MGRQRTINDSNFWRSPKLLNCTTNDKVALLHLLTAPDSNITGVYPIIPRIAGAEVGWTADEWLHVIERLQENTLVKYDAERLIVWVCIWWDHHTATQVTGLKLRARTLQEIQRIPNQWQSEFLTDFRRRLSQDQQRWLDDSVRGTSAAYSGEPSANGYGTDTVSGNFLSNSTNQPKQIKESTTPCSSETKINLSDIDASYHDDVRSAIFKAAGDGELRHDPQTIVDTVARRLKSKSTKRIESVYGYVLSIAARKKLDSRSQGVEQ